MIDVVDVALSTNMKLADHLSPKILTFMQRVYFAPSVAMQRENSYLLYGAFIENCVQQSIIYSGGIDYG